MNMVGRSFILMSSDILHAQVFFVLFLVSEMSCDLTWCHQYITGVGSQFLVLAFGIIIMAMLGLFNVHRWQILHHPLSPHCYTLVCTLNSRHHAMNSAAILLYALTACVAGYVSGSFFKKLGGNHNPPWTWNIILTATLFAMPFFIIWSTVNTVAWVNNSTQALPFTTIILIFIIWLIG